MKANPILKKNKNFYYSNNFNKFVKQFFYAKEDFFTAQNLTDFFRILRENDYISNFDKMFDLRCEDNYIYGGGLYSSFDLKKMKITLNSFSNTKNLELKKATIMIAYLHELTHEKQYDKVANNYYRNIPFENEIQKFISVHHWHNAAKLNYNYNNHIVEIDANMDTINRYVSLLKQNIIPLSMETLIAVFQPIDFVFCNTNMLDNKAFWDKNDISVDASRLMKLYETVYKNFNTKIEKFKIQKYKNVVKEINFNKLKEDIENKYNSCFENIKFVYSEILKRYQPSITIAQYYGYKKETAPTQEEWLELIKNCNPIHILNDIFNELNPQYISSKKEYTANEFEFNN